MKKAIDFKGAKLVASGSMYDGEFEIDMVMMNGADVSDLIDAFDGWDEINRRFREASPLDDGDYEPYEDAA